MSDVDTLFTVQWGDTITQLAQQTKAKIASHVMQKPGVVGERTTMEQLGAVTLEKRTTRHAPTPRADANHQRRWITLFDYEKALWFDKQDELKALLDPRNAYNQAFVAGMNRAMDDEVIAAAFATAYYGKAGTSTQANTNSVAAGGVGLTLDKLRQVDNIFRDGDVDLEAEEKYLAISPDEHDDLLKLTEVISKDYNDRPVLVDGVVKKFMGFNIIVSTRLGTTGGNQCIAWVPSGIGLAIAQAPTLRASELPDYSYAWQGYACIGIGASRLEESKVVEVLCA
jgi:hypothetical protein